MENRNKTVRAASWALLAVAVALGVGGMVYDASQPGDEPNLMWFYLAVAALAFVATTLGYRAISKDRGDRGAAG